MPQRGEGLPRLRRAFLTTMLAIWTGRRVLDNGNNGISKLRSAGRATMGMNALSLALSSEPRNYRRNSVRWLKSPRTRLLARTGSRGV